MRINSSEAIICSLKTVTFCKAFYLSYTTEGDDEISFMRLNFWVKAIYKAASLVTQHVKKYTENAVEMHGFLDSKWLAIKTADMKETSTFILHL